MNDTSTADEADLDEFLGQSSDDQGAKRKKWLIIGGIALLAVLLLALLLRPGADGPRYATVAVERGAMEVYVSATGNLAPTNEVSVGSEVSGLIDKVYVDVNDTVVRGQPLALINTDNLRDQIRGSQASLQQARASVMQSQAAIGQSRAALGRLEEVKRLSGGKVPAASELDAARAQYANDRASLASAQASVQAALAQLATNRTNLARATIRSPVNGVILSRQIEPGQTVAASFNTPTLFVIAEDLTQMELEVKVDEADVGLVKAGQEATFSVDAYPGQEFEARITRINVGSNSSATDGTAAASSNTVVSYGAILAVSNADLALRPGMTATANILTSREQNQLKVPNAALRFEPPVQGEDSEGGFSMFGGPPGSGEEAKVGIGRGSSQSVYVLTEEGELRRIKVRVGSTNGSQTIVFGKQLKAGMKVVTGELTQSP